MLTTNATPQPTELAMMSRSALNPALKTPAINSAAIAQGQIENNLMITAQVSPLDVESVAPGHKPSSRFAAEVFYPRRQDRALDNLRHQGIISRVTGLGGIHPAHGIEARQVKNVTCLRSQLLEVLDFGDSKMITKNISGRIDVRIDF